jgi:Flp pilus assembly protein TadG
MFTGFLARLGRDNRGNVLAILAITMPLTIGVSGLAIDSAQLSLQKRRLQRSADSAALAGAHALDQSSSVRTAVLYGLSLTNVLSLSSDPVVQNAPTEGAFRGDPTAVRVALETAVQTPFISMFSGSQERSVAAEAVAIVSFDGEFCLLALETGNVTGITFQGNSTVDLGCGVATNSKASAAVSASGSASITASPVMARGGIPRSTNYAAGTKLRPYSPAQKDPLAYLPRPAPPSPCGAQIQVQPGATRSVAPGCYKGWDIKGTANLSPGTYFIDGSTVNLGSQAALNGTGVTIILTSTTPGATNSFAGLSINGGAKLNLTAPTFGTYEGVLMYRDPRAAAGSFQINGNSASRIEGAFYFPKDHLTYNGTSGMRTECVQFVARRITVSGNSTIENECPEDGANAFSGTRVRLVS